MTADEVQVELDRKNVSDAAVSRIAFMAAELKRQARCGFCGEVKRCEFECPAADQSASLSKRLSNARKALGYEP